MSDCSARLDAAQPLCVGELIVRVYDLGPEPAYHKDRRLFAPWQRYAVQLADDPTVRARSWSVFEALYVLVSNHRSVLDARWPPAGPDDGRRG